MARKLGKTTDQRMAMLKNLTTDLLVYGRIETTEARAKEVRSLAENLIALAIKEKDNFETVDQKVVKAKLDSKGNKELEKVTSKNGKEYLRVVKVETTEKRQKDMPSRLNARRKIHKQSKRQRWKQNRFTSKTFWRVSFKICRKTRWIHKNIQNGSKKRRLSRKSYNRISISKGR